MKSDSLQPNSETFKGTIQDYLRMSSDRMLEIQTVEQKILFAEFFLHMTAFLEQGHGRIHSVIETENYQKLLQTLDEFRRHSVEQVNNFVTSLRPLNEELIESFSNMDERYMDEYLAVYDAVCKTAQRQIRNLLDIQEQKLIEIGREIISMFM